MLASGADKKNFGGIAAKGLTVTVAFSGKGSQNKGSTGQSGLTRGGGKD